MFTLELPWPDTSLLVSFPWPGLPPVLRGLLLLALCLTPIVLLVVLYRYELRLIPRLTAAWLLGLRLTVLILVLMLVCLRPIYARQRHQELPGRVIVLVDRSASMDMADPQRSGADKLRLARALGWHRGVVADDLLARWIDDHVHERDPQLVMPQEARDDPARRLALQNERLTAHDRLVARVGALTRAELSRLVLADDGLKLLERVSRKHEITLAGFHRDTWEMKPDQLPELAVPRDEKVLLDGPAGFSDLHAPLSWALERSAPGQGKVIGVVLLTDGQHNSGPPPATRARQLGERKIPIFPVAIGPRQAPPDAAIVSLRGPEHTVFKDVEAMIDVRFRIAGLKAQEFLVELHREGKDRKLLGTKSIQHEGKDRYYTESFPVKMDEVGTHTLVATLRAAQPLDKETRTDNNRMTTTVSVADDRARMLLVDGEARWEYHYLATALQRDRLVDLETVVFEQPRLDERLTADQLKKLGLPGQKWPTGPDALSGFQCIVVGDVDPEKLPLAQRQELEKYVADGAGTLILLAGKRFLPLGYPEGTPTGESDPLRRLLPVESPRVLAPASGFALTLTHAGRDTRFMELDPQREDNETLWAGHPRPWQWAISGKAKRGATALAGWLDPREGKMPPSEREREHVVIARHNYGFGRVLFVGIDSTWRWRYKVGDLYHHRFWGQVIRWAAADTPLVVGNSFVRFGTPQTVHRPGEPIEIVVRLAESLGKPRPNLLAGARILRLAEGKEPEKPVALVPLEVRAGQARVLEGRLRDLPPGRYAVELAIPELADRLLEPAREGKQAKPLRAGFTMLPAESKEMIDLETNYPLLEDLARASGGKLFTPAETDELEQLLVRQGTPHVEYHEQRLWQWWGMLAVVVALLTLEWAMRKLAGLP